MCTYMYIYIYIYIYEAEYLCVCNCTAVSRISGCCEINMITSLYFALLLAQLRFGIEGGGKDG